MRDIRKRAVRMGIILATVVGVGCGEEASDVQSSEHEFAES